VDEGNNWINISWGPLSLADPQTGNPLGDYSLAAGSDAINYITAVNSSTTYTAAPANDFFENPRKTNGAVDVGAVEFAAPASAVLNVTGGPLVFGNVPTGTTSAARTLTLQNTGAAGATGIGLVFSSPLYSRPAGAAGGTCGATLAAGANCTINVVFSPTALGFVNATLTINANVAVTGSPVSLSGTGVAPVVSASLTPTSWNATCTPGLLGRGCTTLAPTQAFTLTNTGNVTLTGIAQGVLGGTNANQWTISRTLSTCGPAGGGQLLGQTTLAPGASCVVTVRFQPTTAGAKGPATVSVTDAAGTQSSTLTGTRN
jgi:Abnormal spindle-like microcephaly-assoc'd, ASPM-SPD-2-Hydin